MFEPDKKQEWVAKKQGKKGPLRIVGKTNRRIATVGPDPKIFSD